MGIVRRLARWSFPYCERFGFHIVPVHFYQPIPDSRTLPDSLSQRESAMIGIDLRESSQLELLKYTTLYQQEYDQLPHHLTENNSFGTVDAEVLYSMVRHYQPRNMIEIGGGISTQITAQALRRNEQKCRFICIEPYPSAALRLTETELWANQVQDIPLHIFERLGENDILFIDSSHVVKINGDVNYELLEILPRLKVGVIIHVHDIYLPREYDVAAAKQHRTFLTEQYLLQAFLMFNPHYEILWAANFMHVKYPAMLRTAFASYRKNPAPAFSWWMRRVS